VALNICLCHKPAVFNPCNPTSLVHEKDLFCGCQQGLPAHGDDMLGICLVDTWNKSCFDGVLFISCQFELFDIRIGSKINPMQMFSYNNSFFNDAFSNAVDYMMSEE